MMSAVKQSLSKHRIKIEITIITFGYSVTFDVRKKINKKINWFYGNVILLPRLDFLRKNSGALRWLMKQ